MDKGDQWKDSHAFIIHINQNDRTEINPLSKKHDATERILILF